MNTLALIIGPLELRYLQLGLGFGRTVALTHNLIHTWWLINLRRRHHCRNSVLRIIEGVVDTVRVKLRNPVLYQHHLTQVILLPDSLRLLGYSRGRRIQRVPTFLGNYRNQIGELLVHDLNLREYHLKIFFAAFVLEKQRKLVSLDLG